MMSLVDLRLQERIIAAAPTLPDETPYRLLDTIRSVLFKAQNAGLLQGGLETIYRNVKSSSDRSMHSITGGIKDFGRDPESARIIRDDGAWIHFTITVEWDGKRTLQLITYDFEIVFGDTHRPTFLRFDLNSPDHPNADRELRCHFHPGNDDYLAPAPFMSPEEILTVLTAGLRARDAEHPRA